MKLLGRLGRALAQGSICIGLVVCFVGAMFEDWRAFRKFERRRWS